MANASSAARRRLERHTEGNKGSGSRVINLPEGVEFLQVKDAAVRRFDILGYDVTEKHSPFSHVGETSFERTYYQHANLGPDGKGRTICLKETFGERCPVCEFVATLSWDNEADKAVRTSMRAKERQLFNVYDVADGEKGVQVWDVSFHLFGKVLDAKLAIADPEDGVDDFCDLGMEKGKTIKIGFNEKSNKTYKFYEAASIDFKNRTVDHTKTEVVNLDKCIGHPTYDEVKAIMDGGTSPDASGDDEGTTATPAAQKPVDKAQDTPSGVECPGGGTYGKDVDKYPECAKCPQWNDCDDLTNK